MNLSVQGHPSAFWPHEAIRGYRLRTCRHSCGTLRPKRPEDDYARGRALVCGKQLLPERGLCFGWKPFTFKGHTATDIGSGALATAISWDLGKSLLH